MLLTNLSNITILGIGDYMKLVFCTCYFDGCDTHNTNTIFEYDSLDQAEYDALLVKEHNVRELAKYEIALEEWTNNIRNHVQKMNAVMWPKKPIMVMKQFCSSSLLERDANFSYEILTLDTWIERNIVKDVITEDIL